ncbi:glycosyltransferase [Rathayibacter sp. YIM 133350]|uniref:glycosyltransferase n=1 Tax=Rathayibacter sp. YIM 133350 TaxID=3131992 RepID=UPI00307F8D1B
MMHDPIRDRLVTLLSVLDPLADTRGDIGDLVERLDHCYSPLTADRVWLALSVIDARLPLHQEVVDTVRTMRSEGAKVVLKALARRARLRVAAGRGATQAVRVIEEGVIVDVEHTARTKLATGIQRVVRMSLRHWAQRHDIELAGWTKRLDALRTLGEAERINAVAGGRSPEAEYRHATILVPWRSVYLLPELAIESERTARLLAMAEHSGNRTVAIGFDCVPLTTAETVGLGMGGAFGKNLAALARFDEIVTISESAAVEYRGWKRMLAGAGLSGPRITSVLLPSEAGVADEVGMNLAREELLTEGLPLLLCVGSHEPRKNHLAVLTAAEILWRSGRRFCLAFVGGNSWGSEAFTAQLEQLADRGRPVRAVSAVSDGLLWGGYTLARATVFPSLNEGFGLPVSESLAVGTPVVTSNFGSMREISVGGGALLVDPRNDDALAAALDDVLFDEDVNSRLREEARRRVDRTWADYSHELWSIVSSSEERTRE